MTVELFIKSLESYYLARKPLPIDRVYPALISAAIQNRYSKDPWGPVGRRELYRLVTEGYSINEFNPPDVATLKLFEKEALDQRDQIKLEQKPVPGQKLIAGMTSEEELAKNREVLAAMFADLGKKIRVRKNG